MTGSTSAEPAPLSWILQLRERLSSPPPARLPVSDDRRAAVLVPLYVDAGELWVLLTKRAETLEKHRGQYAFPGGALELGESPWEAATRETEEELGIARARPVSLGELDEATTPSGYRIVPCVAAVPYPLETTLNEGEIAEVFSAPLLAFANPRMVEDRAVEVDGVGRMLRIYHVGSRQVWGLTARILQNLLERLGLHMPGVE
jgi:8-oxo-dGTP pyrophosphatase MutT (NUDIX family)